MIERPKFIILLMSTSGKVIEVTDVAATLEGTPPSLKIIVKGKVPTPGWANGRLSQYFYIVPPQDGIWEFDFVADQPDGIVPQVVTDIESEPFIWASFPADLKGVRVYGSTNSYVQYV